MYNTTLLEEFADDAEGARARAKFEATDEANVTAELANEAVESKKAEEAAVPDTESWSDDPVRMYLTQMGEIPLLTRKEEIRLAKTIEDTRQIFRHRLLECDYVIQNAFNILKRVHRGELPFDRTVQVSVTDRLEKEQILGRLPHNLATIDQLLRDNRRDYIAALNKKVKKSERTQAWKRLGRRRRKAVKLIEELGLRTQRLETMIPVLEDFMLASVNSSRRSIRTSEPRNPPRIASTC